MRRADEQPAVATRGRVPVERREPVVEHVSRLLERDRSDLRHRAQVGERLEHPHRPAQHVRREGEEAFEPAAPRVVVGPRGELVDDRQRELPQMRQVPEVALQARAAGGLGLLARQLVDAAAIVVREAVEPATPPRAAVRARASADHRRFDNQLFPLPRRSQRPFDDRVVVGIGSGVGGRMVRGPYPFFVRIS